MRTNRQSKIEWCRYSINWWTGCTEAQYIGGGMRPGCEHCYAKSMSRRNKLFGQWGDDKERKLTQAPTSGIFARWDKQQAEKPDSFKTPPFVFLNSMSDFAEDRAELQAERLRAFQLLSKYKNLRFLILTKRPHALVKQLPVVLPYVDGIGQCWPDNFYLGITAETQRAFDEGWPKLQAMAEAYSIPRIFLSMEPLFDPIDLGAALLPPLRHRKIDWVIIGGESGSSARETRLRNLFVVAQQVEALRVPLFVKQLGSKPTLLTEPWAISDAKGGLLDEFPVSLQKRQFPVWQTNHNIQGDNL